MPANSCLLLASASPRRRELLAALGIPFTVAEPDLDEAALAARLADRSPEGFALALARAKAESLPLTGVGAVLGADTIVVLDGRILGKPTDPDEARAMLRALRDREHTVVSAIALASAGATRVDHAVARVRMRPYGEDEIERYVASGGPMDKAGAYAIQDPIFAPVRRYEGCHCGIVGLPLWRTAALLAAAGLSPEPPGLPPCASCPDCRIFD